MSKQKSVGVVIGRFQIHELHQGHIALLDYVAERHEELLILVGYNTIRFTPEENPFPFEIRKQVLESRYPEAIIKPVMDSPVSHVEWSRRVDAIVSEVSGGKSAILYGSRDSFIPKYQGLFETVEVPELPNVSATNVRQSVSQEQLNDPAFRLGWLACLHAQFAVTDPTVDMVIHTPDWSQVLLGRRGEGSPLRFFGGFVDSTDPSYEAAACSRMAAAS